MLKVSASAPATIPGATYAPPSPQSRAGRGAQSRSETGSVAGVAPATVKLARFQLAVSTVRGLAIGLLLLTLLILFTKPMKAKREVWSLERRIAHRYGCIVVDVVSIADGALATGAPTRIPDFESLATLARYCERPILREPREDGDAYGVEDGGRLYVHRAVPRPAAAGSPSSEPRSAAAACRAVRRGRRGVPSLVRFGAPTLLLVVAVTSVVAFTEREHRSGQLCGRIEQARRAQPARAEPVLGASTLDEPDHDDDEHRPPARPRPTSSSAATSRRPLTISGGAADDCLVGGGGAGHDEQVRRRSRHERRLHRRARRDEQRSRTARRRTDAR